MYLLQKWTQSFCTESFLKWIVLSFKPPILDRFGWIVFDWIGLSWIRIVLCPGLKWWGAYRFGRIRREREREEKWHYEEKERDNNNNPRVYNSSIGSMLIDTHGLLLLPPPQYVWLDLILMCGRRVSGLYQTPLLNGPAAAIHKTADTNYTGGPHPLCHPPLNRSSRNNHAQQRRLKQRLTYISSSFSAITFVRTGDDEKRAREGLADIIEKEFLLKAHSIGATRSWGKCGCVPRKHRAQYPQGEVLAWDLRGHQKASSRNMSWTVSNNYCNSNNTPFSICMLSS